MNFLRFTDSDAHILDLGCGAGTHLKLALADNPARKAIGIDLCAEMIEEAKKTVPKAVFRCADIRKLSYPKNAFDAVILAGVLQHLKPGEVKDLAAAVAHTLKPDGLLFLNYWEGKYAGFKGLDFADKPMLINYYHRFRIYHLMRECEFACLRTEKYPRTLITGIGPENMEDCYYFGYLLKDVDVSLRLHSAVANPMIYLSRKKKRGRETQRAENAADTGAGAPHP